MNIPAWCGFCGESFRLHEVLEGGNAGACPRCGEAFASGYSAVLAAAVNQLRAAADALDSAARQLADVAPALHVDRRKLYAELDDALER
ncbi:MAG TPA: hypothetical protein VKP64_13360 [Mycobacteriales bacterium]|nr:hypothetical protein [Mycobacteriales bacterium]